MKKEHGKTYLYHLNLNIQKYMIYKKLDPNLNLRDSIYCQENYQPGKYFQCAKMKPIKDTKLYISNNK